MPTQVALKQFARVADVLDRVDSQPVSRLHIKLIMQTAEHFLSGFKHAPDVFVAQTQLYKKRYTYAENLTFNCLVYCCLLCNRVKVNELCTQQMLCSILCLYAERSADLSLVFNEQQEKPKSVSNKNLLLLLEKTHLEVWQQGYQIAKWFYPIRELPLSKIHSLSRTQRIVLLAHALATKTTFRDKSKIPPFPAVLKSLIQQCPQTWLEDLQGLLVYPGTIPPGSVVKLQQQRPGVVVGVTEEKLLVAGLAKNDQQQLPMHWAFKRTIPSPNSVQAISGFSQLHTWWGEEWQSEREACMSPEQHSFAIDKPPMVLLDVQKHLNSGNVDIDKLAEQISTEPAFSEYLKKTATFSNRNKLPVQQVKHGLMMHGYLRANNMLIEQALLLRLNQSYFPLQEDFTQFTRLAAQIAAGLAEKGDDIAPEQASNLACFACSGLFTQSQLKTRIRWHSGATRLYQLDTLFSFKHSQNMQKHALTLCQAWQQPQLFIEAITHHGLMPDKMKQKHLVKTLACLIGLSLTGTRQVFFNHEETCTQTQYYLKQALNLLGLSREIYFEVIEQCVFSTHVHRTGMN